MECLTVVPLTLALRWQIPLLLLLGSQVARLASLTDEAASTYIEDYENYFNEIDVEDVDSEDKNRNALQSPFQRWPGKTLPFRIADDYAPEEAENVRGAVKVFNERTCLHFEEYDETRDRNRRYIYYKKSPDMCGTKVGFNPMTPTGAHDVLLNPYCLTQRAVVQHETMHVLGLFHEQSRYDRNQFVQIDYTNIEQKYWPQFMTYPQLYTTTYDVPYDYESLMHYSQFAFAKDKSKPSIRARGEGDTLVDRPMGQLIGPSEGDLIKLNKMYCKGV